MGQNAVGAVWVDGWQMQCCGETFEIGSEIVWTLRADPDTQWMSSVMDENLVGTITHAEEHHGDLPEGWPATKGLVMSICAVYCKDLPSCTDANRLEPVAGSGLIRQVNRADGWEDEVDGMRFGGYVVEIGDESAIPPEPSPEVADPA